jgi:predicted SAM-dependent methyltransferase
VINLDIGSGGKSQDSRFIGVDAFAEDADVKALMWDLPYEDESVDSIYSSHTLEHTSKYMVVPTLREWRRVLKPGGRIQLIVPDLEWSAKLWLKYRGASWDMDVIFGKQTDQGQVHQTGFTPALLEIYFHVCRGFYIESMDYIGSTLKDIENGATKVDQRSIDVQGYRQEKPFVDQEMTRQGEINSEWQIIERVVTL